MNIAADSKNGVVLPRAFAIAWLVASIFYFLEYAVRSSPAVMIPELAHSFGVPALGVSTILGTYYYTYATTSLIAGVLLDRLGAKYVVPAGVAIMAVGCLVFALPHAWAGDVGRLLQGAGSAFAFTGAVYLASHGFPAQRLATAIGATQCIGMLGGTVGQLAVGPIIHAGTSVATFWYVMGGLALVVGLLLMVVTPKEGVAPIEKAKRSALSTYKIVFSNPQSYLCGLVAGLLFVPTTVGDMIWAVRFFQVDRSLSYSSAVLAASMLPLGWVFGCPLLGYLADRWGKRKPALIGGALVVLAFTIQLAYLPSLMPAWLSLLLMGVASGAAMIPYTIIKEVNPDEVKGSATGGMNFLTFSITAIVGPIFAAYFGKTLGLTGIDPAAHFKSAGLFWVGVVGLAIVVAFFLKETGHHRVVKSTT